MEDLLKDMYYQRIRLKNDSIKRQKELCELSALIERNEQALKNKLNSEERKLFEKYLDGINDFNSLECCN